MAKRPEKAENSEKKRRELKKKDRRTGNQIKTADLELKTVCELKTGQGTGQDSGQAAECNAGNRTRWQTAGQDWRQNHEGPCAGICRPAPCGGAGARPARTPGPKGARPLEDKNSPAGHCPPGNRAGASCSHCFRGWKITLLFLRWLKIKPGVEPKSGCASPAPGKASPGKAHANSAKVAAKPFRALCLAPGRGLRPIQG